MEKDADDVEVLDVKVVSGPKSQTQAPPKPVAKESEKSVQKAKGKSVVVLESSDSGRSKSRSREKRKKKRSRSRSRSRKRRKKKRSTSSSSGNDGKMAIPFWMPRVAGGMGTDLQTGGGSHGMPIVGNPTEGMCHDYSRGHCSRGESCRFQHST
mmetsp:Transcript_20312/g.56444  ORF Transcript_20312/g.56444 Transcript_20312/m.56444 type:complete len:154 (-) Transcript_20312:150-611(-)